MVGEDTPRLCQVSAGVDALTDTVFVVLQSLDPDTGLPTQGGDIGLLPPNGEGLDRQATGYVAFSARADAPAAPGALPPSLSGRRPRNTASITFNANPSLSTNTTENLLDGGAPVSGLAVEAQDGALVTLAWQGSDLEMLPSGEFPGSGMAGYSVYVAGDPEGPWTAIVTDTLETSAVFEGSPGATHHFKVEAKDLVGNEESKPGPDASVALPADCKAMASRRSGGVPTILGGTAAGWTR